MMATHQWLFGIKPLGFSFAALRPTYGKTMSRFSPLLVCAQTKYKVEVLVGVFFIVFGV